MAYISSLGQLVLSAGTNSLCTVPHVALYVALPIRPVAISD